MPTISEIAPAKIRLCCKACGERLFDYDFEPSRTDDGVVVEVIPFKRGKRRGAPTARGWGFEREMSEDGLRTRERWSCRCGADIVRRSDRWNAVEVDERFDPPRVYV